MNNQRNNINMKLLRLLNESESTDFKIQKLKVQQWGKIYTAIRTVIANNTKFKPVEFNEDFKYTVSATDEFWVDDYELSSAFSNFYKNANTRLSSDESPYHFCSDVVERFDIINDAFATYIDEVNDNISRYYNNPMNFDRGYEKPSKIILPNPESSKLFDEFINTLDTNILPAIKYYRNISAAERKAMDKMLDKEIDAVIKDKKQIGIDVINKNSNRWIEIFIKDFLKILKSEKRKRELYSDWVNNLFKNTDTSGIRDRTTFLETLITVYKDTDTAARVLLSYSIEWQTAAGEFYDNIVNNLLKKATDLTDVYASELYHSIFPRDQHSILMKRAWGNYKESTMEIFAQ